MNDSPPEDPEDAPPTSSTTPLPYEFNAEDASVAIPLVDAAFSTLDEYQNANAIREAGKEAGLSDTPLLRELWIAASYRLRREIAGKPGSELDSLAATSDQPWPPAVATISGEVVELWKALAAGVAAPAAIARFEDLLFIRRDGNGRERALRACRAYLDAIDLGTLDMDAIDALLRVWTLARSIRDIPMEAEVRSRFAVTADETLSASPGERPGVAIPLLAALAEGTIDSSSHDPEDVDGLLTRASSFYSKGHLASQIASYRRKRATNDPIALEQIARDEIASYFAEADAAPHPAVRMIHLEGAAKVASQRGVTDLAREAASRMQQIPFTELGMQRISIPSSMPRFVSEAFVSGFTRSHDWRDGLGYFFAQQPPSGTLDQLKRMAQPRSPLARLFPSTIFGAGGLPRASTTTEADEDDHDLALSARITAEYQGALMAEGLRRFAQRYGARSEDELVAFLTLEGCRDAQLARSLSKGFRHYWAGDFESCVSVIVPRFEAAARNLLRELDEGIYRVQKGRDPGGYVGLFVLLSELETLELDESWGYFCRWLFLGPYGANLRNDIAHGFVVDPGPTYATLALRAVSMIALLGAADPHDPSDGMHPDGNRRRPRKVLLELLHSPIGHPSRGEMLLGRIASYLERAAWRIRARQARRAIARRKI